MEKSDNTYRVNDRIDFQNQFSYNIRLRAKKTFISKKLGHTAVSAIVLIKSI